MKWLWPRIMFAFSGMRSLTTCRFSMWPELRFGRPVRGGAAGHRAAFQYFVQFGPDIHVLMLQEFFVADVLGPHHPVFVDECENRHEIRVIQRHLHELEHRFLLGIS